jgi:hypothetical protein
MKCCEYGPRAVVSDSYKRTVLLRRNTSYYCKTFYGACLRVCGIYYPGPRALLPNLFLINVTNIWSGDHTEKKCTDLQIDNLKVFLLIFKLRHF